MLVSPCPSLIYVIISFRSPNFNVMRMLLVCYTRRGKEKSERRICFTLFFSFFSSLALSSTCIPFTSYGNHIGCLSFFFLHALSSSFASMCPLSLSLSLSPIGTSSTTSGRLVILALDFVRSEKSFSSITTVILSLLFRYFSISLFLILTMNELEVTIATHYSLVRFSHSPSLSHCLQ